MVVLYRWLDFIHSLETGMSVIANNVKITARSQDGPMESLFLESWRFYLRASSKLIPGALRL